MSSSIRQQNGFRTSFTGLFTFMLGDGFSRNYSIKSVADESSHYRAESTPPAPKPQ
jgi:hypothetical protein